MGNNNIITVALPVYNQTGVLNIALEGLARQREAGGWELIVCSENDVWDVVNNYRDRLLEAGCENIICDKIETWIPLPQKWRRIGLMISPNSVGMMLHAADCYSHPDRIKQSKQAMINGYDWYHESAGYFYSIGDALLVKYDNNQKGKTHLNMCIASNHAKKLPKSDLRKNIDGWMYRTIQDPKVYQDYSLHSGVDLHGMNNISIYRGKFIKDCACGFKPVDVTIDTIGLPIEIVKIIKELKTK